MSILLLACVPIIQSLPANHAAGALSVVVKDIPGDPLAAVRISLEGFQQQFQTETTQTGTATFESLPAGKYKLRAEKEGYRTLNQDLFLNGPASRTLTLRLVKEPARPASKP